MGKKLTDDQLKIILESVDQPLHMVTAKIGKPGTTVWYARERLKAGKWVCAVRFEPCRWCGETLTVRGAAIKHFYHPHCARPAHTDYLKRRDAARPKDPEKLRRLHERTAAIQQETRQTAQRYFAHWTAEEDAVVLDLMKRPVSETALQLRRTYSAVANRRRILRERHNKKTT